MEGTSNLNSCDASRKQKYGGREDMMRPLCYRGAICHVGKKDKHRNIFSLVFCLQVPASKYFSALRLRLISGYPPTLPNSGSKESIIKLKRTETQRLKNYPLKQLLRQFLKILQPNSILIKEYMLL